MAILYQYMDADGRCLEVLEEMIPGVGLGLRVHTTNRGLCIPLEEVPRLMLALDTGLHVFPTQERQHGNTSGSGVGTGQ